jgi:hypothetical protein
MSDLELRRSAKELPDIFADRVSAATLRNLRSLAGAGEWDEELDLLVAGLKETGAWVSREELDRLRTLFTGWKIPTDILDDLNVGD